MKKTRNIQTYEYSLYCHNCDNIVVHDIPRGMTVFEYRNSRGMICPHCHYQFNTLWYSLSRWFR